MTAPIRLTNSLTRRKEAFAPLDPDNVRMYVCGPTVYDRAHMGNGRAAVVFDVLYRLLRHTYGADHVTYARNITDVDDKINARAAETGRSIAEIADETCRWYAEDMAALGNLVPDATPRATRYIPQMVAMIGALIESGHAYEREGHVLFRVRSYEDYGSFSGRSLDEMHAGARVEVAPYKEDPMDFVLWKPSGEDQPGWDSPWGVGRPGWHIECSAMSAELLGRRFDIHGGGADLMFPHHENEIAQSRCVHGGEEMAQVWLHNEMLQVEGRKMSKSLGNFFSVRDMLERGVPGEVIRFVLLGTHYRKPMDWTERRVDQAERILGHWHRIRGNATAGPAPAALLEALGDDLNTHAAIDVLRDTADAGDIPALLGGLDLLGLRTIGADPADAVRDEVAARIDALLADRRDARASRDFERADALRDLFTAAGIVVMDSDGGTQWRPGPGFDPSKLEVEG